MGIAERLLDASFGILSRKYLIALCSGSTAPGACAQKVFTRSEETTQLLKCLDIPGWLRHAQRAQNFHAPRQPALRHGVPSCRRIRGQRTLPCYAPATHADFVVPTAIASGAQTAACFTDAFELIGRSRCASVRPVPAPPGCRFEFQAIAHTAARA